MKKSFRLLIIIAALFITSCEKANVKLSLPGSWQLSQVSGGMIGNQPAGKGYGLELTGTEYRKFENGQVVKSGTYTLVYEKPLLSDRKMYRIIYDNDLKATKQFIDIKKGTMIIYLGGPNVLDGLQLTYLNREIN
jgi:hypothetical protein